MTAKASRKPVAATSARPYTTVYSGAFNGHCKTLKSANKAAFSHLIDDEYRFAEIFGPDGESIARLRWEGGRIAVLPGFKRSRVDLRRVK
jgi:hypothetical protein